MELYIWTSGAETHQWWYSTTFCVSFLLVFRILWGKYILTYRIKKLMIRTRSIANLKVPQSWIAADVFARLCRHFLGVFKMSSLYEIPKWQILETAWLIGHCKLSHVHCCMVCRQTLPISHDGHQIFWSLNNIQRDQACTPILFHF